ncbi:YhgE/Pip family protein [Gorillibacterium timonense]|uniref:YhgE/Pip family protein n=1 Tax=Gorillibacterium timonense TaxID=1689269 RepID=UPI00071DC4AB|nr:YhgE/Pip domain-containing protein [Gorillibacterium timonense]
MRGLTVFFHDFKQMLRKPVMMITLLVIAFLPILYSGVMLKGAWDPYGKLDQLPIAVVNLDTGADFEGESLQIGKDLIEELQKSKTFDWSFVSEAQAKDGITRNHYYMTITIPKDFSQKATTLMGEHPEQAEILYEPNWDSNYVAAQIGTNGVKEIKASISAKITESYTRSMFAQFQKVSSGLGEAGDGAQKLNDGADKVEKGLLTLSSNMSKLTDGTLQVKDGLKPLEQGAAQLNSGAISLSTGAASLADGLKQLASAQTRLEHGTTGSKQGANQLKNGLQASVEGSKNLVSGLEASSEGAVKLSSGLNASTTASSQVADGAQKVAYGLKKLVESNPQLAQSPQVQQLVDASEQVAQGSEKLIAGQQQLADGSKTLTTGQQQLLEGSRQLEQGQQQLLQGAEKLAAGQDELRSGMQQFGVKLTEAAAGGSQVAAGASRVNEGAARLQGGFAQLQSGVGNLADGSQMLESGADQLQNGAAQVTDGLGQLVEKLNDAGSRAASMTDDDSTVTMFAQPVKLTENTDRKVSVYGLGIAPYFLSMSLFVGGLVLTVVVPPRKSNALGASSFGRFLSRTLTFLIMGLAQSLIASLILLYGFGIEVQSVPLFLLFTSMTSLTFLMIIQAIVTWLDQPGRFVVIILMILQLTSSAGTFPRELLPGWMRSLNPFLPMTHSIKGFKAVILSGDFSLMWTQVGILACYALPFLLLTLLYFVRPGDQDDAREDNVVPA